MSAKRGTRTGLEKSEHRRNSNSVATDLGQKPGDFPIASLQSRAAARSLLESRRAAEHAGILFQLRFIGKAVEPNQRCTCKAPPAGVFALCRCFSPEVEKQRAS